jgi:nitrite reductase/ring-hydroxylating ferredoxin subunit
MSTPTRRNLLAGAGAIGLTAALTGCAAYGDGVNAAEPPPAPPSDAKAGSNPKPGSGAPASGGGFAKTADIPVGGGKIFADQKIVVTQPTAGAFRCFSAVCTHAGCLVGDVSNGTINCACHGSKFKVADGSVTNGPAKKPLSSVAIKVNGGNISKA